MTRGARLLMLLAAVVVLVVAFIALRPAAKDEGTTADTPTTTPTAAQTSTPTAGETSTATRSPSPKPTVDPGPLLTGASVEKIRVDKGDIVRFRVRSSEAEEVHVHGYDLKKDLEPGETATATASPTPRPTVDPGPVLTGSSVEKLRYDKGDTVRFQVKAPEDEEVHIHGYDIKKDVKAGVTTKISFKATIDGIFEIEFEESAKQIAELRDDP